MAERTLLSERWHIIVPPRGGGRWYLTAGLAWTCVPGEAATFSSSDAAWAFLLDVRQGQSSPLCGPPLSASATVLRITRYRRPAVEVCRG